MGGGLAAISLAYFLQDRDDISEIIILEKENKIGGLCRSFVVNGVTYDIGPHIIFSKNKDILEFMQHLLGENQHQLRRSNMIIHQNKFIQYPFENDLSKLSQDDLDYCVNCFLHNPYENYIPNNMLQFFLQTFGEGITNLYLRPYNEKIWKFDPAFMDTQMVGRIPKPPKEDILSSAAGKTVDGYLHQLYFSYPKVGGIESLIAGFVAKFKHKIKILTEQNVVRIEKNENGFLVTTDKSSFQSEELVSTIPANLLCDKYIDTPSETKKNAANLKYNSIVIAIINVKKDLAGDNFAFMVADKSVIFHRISKLDFLGDQYRIQNTVTYMVEITYHKNDLIDLSSDAELLNKITHGLLKVGFIESEQDINFTEMKRFEYAYVIYDLEHRNNMNEIINYFRKQGIKLHGRFGEFEYLNMDRVIERSMRCVIPAGKYKLC